MTRSSIVALATVTCAGIAACDAPQKLAPREAFAASDRAVAVASRVPTGGPKPSIVLVHGAFADATGWQELIPSLQNSGYSVIAVQNPLTSVAADIATTKRVIDAQPGDVVVVGHSYGGFVISGAAAGNPKVKALVYVAAYAPDAGESVDQLNHKFAPTPIATSTVVDAAGFVYIDAAKYRDVFAGDVPERMTRVMAVTQKPASFTTLYDVLPVTPAWRTIPTWYVVAQQDRTINPDLERYLAQRMGARTTELRTSHIPFISRPQEIARIILDAAESSLP